MRDALRGGGLPSDILGGAGAGPVAGSGGGAGSDDHALEYWRSGRGLSNITPAGKQWPEGEGFAGFLAGLVGPSAVIEFGCGIGRLAGCFEPQRYFGVDICPRAVEIAGQTHPDHSFALLEELGELPLSADVTLAHTVLLHVSDEALNAVIARFESPRVIVSEILGRHWRRTGNPPVFNREMSDYEAAFAPRYRLAMRHAWPYPHYRDTSLTVMEFEKVR